jgi:hypothetical protein
VRKRAKHSEQNWSTYPFAVQRNTGPGQALSFGSAVSSGSISDWASSTREITSTARLS